MAKKSSTDTKQIIKLFWQASQPYKWRRNLTLISKYDAIAFGSGFILDKNVDILRRILKESTQIGRASCRERV